MSLMMRIASKNLRMREEKRSNMGSENGFKNFLCSKLGRAGMIVFFYGIIFGLTMLLTNIFSNSEIVGVVMAVFFGYFGWQALTRITPSIFLVMPIGGWLLYFLIKGVLSFLIGIFVAPFVISKKIVAAIEKNI